MQIASNMAKIHVLCIDVTFLCFSKYVEEKMHICSFQFYLCEKIHEMPGFTGEWICRIYR